MPRKPVFERTPLVRRVQLPLSDGMLRAEDPLAASLLKRLPETMPTEALEGAVRLSACLGADPEACPAAAAVREAVKRQREDGALPDGIAGSVALARAAWALAGWSGERSLAEAVIRWLGWLAARYDEVVTDADLRDRPADLAELLTEVYRATGLQGALRLLARLRRDVTDWSTILNTFSLDRPYRESPVSGEGAEALRQRQRLLADPTVLADALRGVRCLAEYSGNGTEHEAGERGWQRISRWHGQVCGGTSAAPLLGGRSPRAEIRPAAVGAWAECLAGYAAAGEAWAMNPLEHLAVNALPVAGRLQCFSVNGKPGPETADAESLGRLMRGWAAVLSASACVRPGGLSLLCCRDMAFVWTDGAESLRVRVRRCAGEVQMAFAAEKPVRMNLSLRIPDWMINGTVAICGGDPEDVKAETSWAATREWRDGDTLRLTYGTALTAEDGYHQGRAVYHGAELMTWPAENAAGYPVLAGEPFARDGRVFAALCVSDASVGADVPVLPRLKGESFEAELQPFAAVREGIAVFAGLQAP